MLPNVSHSFSAARAAPLLTLGYQADKDQRALLSAEAQYRDQLTERNTLLLTIYQYMDKILGVDKTPVGPLWQTIILSGRTDRVFRKRMATLRRSRSPTSACSTTT